MTSRNARTQRGLPGFAVRERSKERKCLLPTGLHVVNVKFASRRLEEGQGSVLHQYKLDAQASGFLCGMLMVMLGLSLEGEGPTRLRVELVFSSLLFLIFLLVFRLVIY